MSSKALDFLGLDSLPAPSRAPAPTWGDDDDVGADMTSALMGGEAAPASAAPEADDTAEIERAQAQAQRQAGKETNKKTSKKSSGGGFQSMNLAPWLLRNILLRNFHLPTPIQRAAIPAILTQPARDVLAMARTGSGKTLAYIVPLLQMLGGRHRSAYGARAIVLVPSRELAMQVLRVTKDLGRGKRNDEEVDPLRFSLLTGGDSLEDDFAKLAANPDVIIATPGRLLHVVVEADVSLGSVEYAVFDEADRLFELGLAEQLDEIIARLPPTRQTVLCSATLPKSLVQFARVGLQHNPRLVRLDAEAHISDALQMAFLSSAPDGKEATLLCLLRNVIGVPMGKPESHKPQFGTGANAPTKEKKATRTLEPYQTVVFAATKHHVEYYHTLLSAAGWTTGALYSSLDQSARMNEMAKFQAGKTAILVVTDVAARGIDLPLLGHVVNLDLPPQPRTFVHRVGRTARAGAQGWAWTIVSTAELAYLADLATFLTRPVLRTPWAPPDPAPLPAGCDALLQSALVLGALPADEIETEQAFVTSTLPLRSDAAASDLTNLRQVAAKAQKMYERSRPQPTPSGYKRAKTWMQEAHDTSALPRVAQAAQKQAAFAADQNNAPGIDAKLPLPLQGSPAAESGVHMVYARPDLFGLGNMYDPKGNNNSNINNRAWGATTQKDSMDVNKVAQAAAFNAAEAAARASLLAKISAFTPPETVLESARSVSSAGKGQADSTAAALMRKRRTTLAQARVRKAQNEAHEQAVEQAVAEADELEANARPVAKPTAMTKVPQAEAAPEEIEDVFGVDQRPKKKSKVASRLFQLERPQAGAFQDRSSFVSYTPRGDKTDTDGMFVAEANAMAEEDLNDEGGRAAGQRAGDTNQRPNARKWDTGKKKFVRTDQRGQDNTKMIKTESGTRLPASFRSGRYDAWAKQNRMNIPRLGQNELDVNSISAPGMRSALDRAASTKGAPGGKKMIHTKLTAPQDPAKRQNWNPAAKQEAAEAMDKHGGPTGPHKILQKGKNKGKKKIMPKSGARTGSGGKNEIKSAQDIHKQRTLLAQRKAKNARAPARGKGKGRK